MSSVVRGGLIEGPIPPAVESCEHCLTVTWAGVPACDCGFGKQAIEEDSTWALRLDPRDVSAPADR